MEDEVGRMLAVLEESFPAVHEMTAVEARKLLEARAQPVTNIDDVASTEDLTVRGVSGNAIPIRVYRPHGSEGRTLPAIAFHHGGGFVFCSIESHDGFCRMLSRNTGTVVVSVDYRLAPEHPAPAAAEDAYSVLLHLVAHAGDLGIDASQIVVAGDSAGGNLAAVVALMARDSGDVDLAGQVLLYPVIEPDFTTESYQRYGTGHFNTLDAMQWYWRQYLGNDDMTVPEPQAHVAPLRASDHSRLAPAVVVTAGRDPLSSEGAAYAATLAAAGVPVRHRHYPELFHGFVTIGPFGPAVAARNLLWNDVLGLLPDHTMLERSTHV